MDRKLIFLGGLHRSGTSLLFKILRDHPAISGFKETGVPEDEGQLLQSVYPAAREYGGPGRFGFDTRAFLDERSALVSEANAAKLFDQWSHHWDLSAEWLLEKSPPNLVRMRFLEALFPGSHFIMLLRHPVAVSLATQKWSRTSVAALLQHWVLCHERFAGDRDHISRLLVLRYEDFVKTPGACLERVYGFLKLEPDQLRRQIRQDVNEAYFRRWRQAGSRRPAQVAELVRQFEARVRPFGYSLENLDFAPGT